MIDRLTPLWAAQLVAAFDASGVHRVGTPGDLASGDWLARQASELDVEVSRVSVPLNQTIVEEAYLECAGLRVDGLPMFDSPPTSAAGVTGLLCASGDTGDIGYAEFPPNAASIKGQPLEKMRRSARHDALIVATRVSGESLAPINAQHYDTPFGPPVLLVAGMHHAFLAENAAKHTPVGVVSTFRHVATESFNVTATIANAKEVNSSQIQPLAVVTPRTGWWESTTERAGGLIAWLAAIQAAGALRQRNQLRRDVYAYATCGHELGHLGLNALTGTQATPVRNAHYWLHLGANLGGTGNLTLFIRAADAGDAQQMHDLLVAEGYPAAHVRIEPVSKMSGEGRDLTHLGSKVLSLAGSNPHFHAASDRWPGNVNTAGIASIARAVARWIEVHAG
jgi:hypothetical protein